MGRNTLFCSFCGKSQHEVRKLIAGPTVFICNECIVLCGDIINEQPRTAGVLAIDLLNALKPADGESALSWLMNLRITLGAMAEEHVSPGVARLRAAITEATGRLAEIKARLDTEIDVETRHIADMEAELSSLVPPAIPRLGDALKTT